MIAKHVSMKSVRKSGFASLVEYIVDAQRKQERVGAVFVSNCHTDQPEVALTEILNTQMQNVRARSDKTYHLIVSFRPGEQLGDATPRQIEARLCDALGFGEHQRISAVHRDTDNLHMHVAINKIHPTRYTMREPFNDFWVLAQACQHLERDFGLEPDNHKAGRSASENRAADMEQHAGIESLIGWIQRECAEQMRHAASWTALHSLMRQNGLRLHERGNGLVISAEDGTSVKASSIGREFSKVRLEALLGSFVSAPEADHTERPAKTYKARPLRSRMDTTGLYAAYQEAQQQAAASRVSESAQASAHKQRQVDAAKRSARLKRALIEISGIGRPSRKLMYGIVSKNLLRELDAIATKYRSERRQIGDKYRRQTWADWLQAKAAAGNVEALAALRARPGYLTPLRDTLAGSVASAGKDMPRPTFAGQDSVTKQGTVIYRFGATTVRDDGKALHVAGHADAAGLQAAMRMAQKLYGDRIRVNGSDAFKEAVVQAAVAGRMTINFDHATLEQRRKDLSHIEIEKEKRHEHSTPGAGRSATGRIVRGRTAGAPAGERKRQIGTHPDDSSRSARQPDVGAIGRHPPPEGQHRLRALSELGMVRIADGSQMLLPGDVSAHLEQPRAATVDQLRWHVSGSGKVSGAEAAAQYVREQEQRRLAGLPVPRHIAFQGKARTLALAGTQTRAGQGLALLRDGQDILVTPVDAAALLQLQRTPIGIRVTVSSQGVARSRSRGR
jgi:hypothetical protein